MDQASSATALSGTPSLLGGLLSQLDSGSTQDGLFSNLLSDSDSLASVLAVQPVAATATASSNVTNALNTANGASSSYNVLQTLDEFSKTLNRTLAVLHQQNTQASTNNKTLTNHTSSTQTTAASSATTATNSQTTAQGKSTATGYGSTGSQSNSGWRTNQTVKESSKAVSTTSTSAPVSSADTNPDTDISNTASTSTNSVTDPQTLAAIIAQLLAMTQALIKNLEKAPSGTGNSDTAQTPTDATVGQAGDSGATGTADSITNLVAALKAVIVALPQLTGATSATTSSSSADTKAATPADFLPQLISDMQKTLQKLAPLVNAAPASSTTSSAASSVTASTAAVDAAADQTSLADMLKPVPRSSLTPVTSGQTGIVADMVAKASTAPEQTSVAAKAVASATTNIGAKKTVVPLTVTPSIAQEANATQPTVTDTQVPVTPQVTKETAKAATVNAQSQMLAVQSSLATEAVPQTPTNQAATNAAALVAVAAKTGDGATDSGGDFSSDNGKTASFASAKTAEPNAASAGLTQAAGTYNFASTLSAIRAVNGGTTGLPTVADQIILQMSRSIKSGNDQMSLQLQPGDLGKITVKLNFSNDGKVQGTVTADNPQTLDMLQKDSRNLERALQDAGLRADPGSLQFNLGGQGNGHNAGQAGNNTNGNANGTHEDGTISATDNGTLASLGAVAETYYVTPNGVNIRV